jgi:hypothetical protein
VVVVLFWAAISHRVYRGTLPHAVLERVFGEDAFDGPFAITTLLRKFYSVMAFAVIGFVVDRALPRTRRPALRAALIVAAFSALIEVAQKFEHAREGPLSEAFDIACGALGGWLAVTLTRRWPRRPTRADEGLRQAQGDILDGLDLHDVSEQHELRDGAARSR